jgi:hypothetical protein
MFLYLAAQRLLHKSEPRIGSSLCDDSKRGLGDKKLRGGT